MNRSFAAQRTRRGVLPAGSEAAFQTAVVGMLGYTGWSLVYHTHNSQRSAPGFPDVVAVHDVKPWMLLAELKGAGAGRRAKVADVAARDEWLRDAAVTNDQAAWLAGVRRVETATRRAMRELLTKHDQPAYAELPRIIVKLWRDDADGWADIERTLGQARGGHH